MSDEIVKARVVSVDKDIITFERSANDCSSGGCSGSCCSGGDRRLRMKTDQEFSVGNYVEIVTNRASKIKYSLLSYLVPIFIITCVALFSNYMGLDDMKSALAAIAAAIPAWVIVKLTADKQKRPIIRKIESR